MKRENISAEEARRILLKDDEERRKWSLKVFGIDTWDPRLYDLVIHISCITVDEAVDIIKCALKGHCFQTTLESQKIVDEKSLAARVAATLVQEIPGIKVEAKEGELFIYVKQGGVQRRGADGPGQTSGRQRRRFQRPGALPHPAVIVADKEGCP